MFSSCVSCLRLLESGQAHDCCTLYVCVQLEHKLFKTVHGANLQDFQAVLLRHKAGAAELLIFK